MRRFLRIGLAVIALAWNTGLKAETVRVEPDSAVTPGSTIRYRDLVTSLLPDILGDGSKADVTPGKGIRHIGGADMLAYTVQTEPQSISRLDFVSPAGKRALILFDFGTAEDAAQSVAILGLYDLAGEPKLLDAADVGYDRFTSFQAPEIAFAAPDAPVTFFRSSHLNAGEEYVQTSLVSLAGDRINLIDSIGTMNWNGCAWSIMSDLGFRATSGTIRATIHIRKTKLDGTGCEPNRNERRIRPGRIDGTYVWEASRKRFKARTAAFKSIPFPGGDE
ncbi:hypothetical protein [Rhizobium alvei]|uniref:Uncharacterized protein n=1 Tax=Rhizobium alvei TaxID=1132659 RepID=A0ABT8YQ79_9HYPH|nr:hypothetical protein [Rhizobium alvei]MDO6965862.1 hypothetical protein [Rhizobium alvei]